jgi:extradiol dioxygenase family protein
MQIEFVKKDFGLLFRGDTWAGFIRPCKSWDGRWSRRWVKLPWFGHKVTKKRTKTRVDSNTVRTRHQRIIQVWIPYLLFYYACNELDSFEITQKSS